MSNLLLSVNPRVAARLNLSALIIGLLSITAYNHTADLPCALTAAQLDPSFNLTGINTQTDGSFKSGLYIAENDILIAAGDRIASYLAGDGTEIDSITAPGNGINACTQLTPTTFAGCYGSGFFGVAIYDLDLNLTASNETAFSGSSQGTNPLALTVLPSGTIVVAGGMMLVLLNLDLLFIHLILHIPLPSPQLLDLQRL